MPTHHYTTEGSSPILWRTYCETPLPQGNYHRECSMSMQKMYTFFRTEGHILVTGGLKCMHCDRNAPSKGCRACGLNKGLSMTN